MKVQYFGDVNDYRKFALLRLLAQEGGLKLGVCWMMTDPDERQDGNNRVYLGQPEKWRAFDPVLFDALKNVPAQPKREFLDRFEQGGTIPGAEFFNDDTPDEKTKRAEFHQKCLAAMRSASLMFFDPDNGMEVPSRALGRKGSNKFVYYDEIADHYALGRSILIYQHFPRKPRSVFPNRISGFLRENLPQAQIWSFETAHVAFMLAAQPAHLAGVRAAAEFVEREWAPHFFKSVRRHDLDIEQETEAA
jgi:hypothetical protein